MYNLPILLCIYLSAFSSSVLNFDSRDFPSIIAEPTGSFYLLFSCKKKHPPTVTHTVSFSGGLVFLCEVPGLLVDACHPQNDKHGSFTSILLVSRLVQINCIKVFSVDRHLNVPPIPSQSSP